MDKSISLSSSTYEPAIGSASLQCSILNIIEVATTGLAPGTDGEPFDPVEIISVNDELKILTINGAFVVIDIFFILRMDRFSTFRWNTSR